MPASSPFPLELQGSLSWHVGGRSLGGKNRVGLLRAIAATGSITQAAKSVGLSYKAAWDAVDTMNNLAGLPLVERHVGGKSGGGTRLTERGAQLVERYDALSALHDRYVQTLNRLGAGWQQDADLLRTLHLKTSARNQFAGRVVALTHGAVNDEVELESTGGLRIVAVVTHDSAESLGLAVGVDAYALVKASSVIVATEVGSGKLSARNQLAGTVSRVHAGAVNDEVVIDLAGGGTIAAIVTHDSAETLGLAPGVAATAVFKASSVILGMGMAA